MKHGKRETVMCRGKHRTWTDRKDRRISKIESNNKYEKILFI